LEGDDERIEVFCWEFFD